MKFAFLLVDVELSMNDNSNILILPLHLPVDAAMHSPVFDCILPEQDMHAHM